MSKGVTALLEFGVYTDALIKRQKYWPKGVPVDAIDQYFADKDVAYVDMLEAITEEVTEGKAFDIFFLQGTIVCHEDYGLQHIRISNIFFGKVLVNGVSRYTLGPLFALIGECSSIDTKLQQG